MRKIKRLVLIFIILFLSGIGTVTIWLMAGIPSLESLPEQLAIPSSKILDRNGRLLYEIIDPAQGGHAPVPISQIPLYCQQATIAVEDANYYQHPGIDPVGIIRALWIDLQGNDTLVGGSTITQQVARYVLLGPEETAQRTLVRKFRESVIAWRMSRSMTKEEVLALYMNQIFYGNLSYGIESAANGYFGKPAADLDLAECAMLAGIPQSPALFDPLIQPEAAIEKQELVLDLMVKQGYITLEEAARAKDESLHYTLSPFPIEAPHFVSYVWNQIESALGSETIRAGGLMVTTTLDLDLQQSAEAILQRRLERLQNMTPPRNVTNGGIISMDPVTGEVLVMVGSPYYFDARIDGAVNVTLAARQPGSALKPFTYAAAFSRTNGWTPATVLFDVRSSFPTREGTPYVPLNYDRTFHGPVSVRQALGSSYNIPAVKALQYAGLDSLVKLMRDLGITTFDDAGRFGLALTLGGGEVRLLELTAAYGALANGGYRVEPVVINQVTQLSGDSSTALVKLNTKPESPATPTIDPRVAWLITDILSDDAARAPSFGRGSVLKLSRPAAVKTGTTTDWRDNWTVGYTPELVTGVWVGNADNSAMVEVSGVTGAGPVWRDLMETALAGRPATAFQQPDGLSQVEVCSLSGKLPTNWCPYTRTEWFLEENTPSLVDDWYQVFQVDRSTGLLADENTPPRQVVEKIYLVLPSELAQWAREQNIPSPPLSAAIATGGPGEQGQALAITSPDNGVTYRITPSVPPEQQKIRLTAAAQVPLERVTFFIDNSPVGADRPPAGGNSFAVFWQLEKGQHELVARGRTADGSEVESEGVAFTVH